MKKKLCRMHLPTARGNGVSSYAVTRDRGGKVCLVGVLVDTCYKAIGSEASFHFLIQNMAKCSPL